MTTELYVIFSTLQVLVMCAIIIFVNYRAGKRDKEVASKLLDTKVVLNLAELKGEINNMTETKELRKDVAPHVKVTSKELFEKDTVMGLINAEPNEQAYQEYVDLLCTKVADRYYKTFFKYYKATRDEDNPDSWYNSIAIDIAPEDFEVFLLMNGIFVRNNLDNKEVTRRFAERITDFINFEGAKVIYYPQGGFNTITQVSDISKDSTIHVFLNFIEEDLYDKWKSLNDEKYPPLED